MAQGQSAGGRCPGYVVDHTVPLKRGGPDDPSNMLWQKIAEAKLKDRTERKIAPMMMEALRARGRLTRNVAGRRDLGRTVSGEPEEGGSGGTPGPSGERSGVRPTLPAFQRSASDLENLTDAIAATAIPRIEASAARACGLVGHAGRRLRSLRCQRRGNGGVARRRPAPRRFRRANHECEHNNVRNRVRTREWHRAANSRGCSNDGPRCPQRAPRRLVPPHGRARAPLSAGTAQLGPEWPRRAADAERTGANGEREPNVWLASAVGGPAVVRL
jgi:hypothetical protein